MAEVENAVLNGQQQVDGPETKAKKSVPKKAASKATSTTKKANAPKKNEGKLAKGKDSQKPQEKEKKTKVLRSFPATAFENSLEIANAIQKFAAGQRVRRLTLFDYLGKSPDSGLSRQLITNSARYNLTTGGYQAEFIDLTEEGKLVTSSEVPESEKIKAVFKLAIQSIKPFNAIYEQYKNSKLPSPNVIKDFLVDGGYLPNEVSECVDTFVVNAKYIGVLKLLSGTERLVPIESILEEIPRSGYQTKKTDASSDLGFVSHIVNPTVSEPKPTTTWDTTCFYITPIGEDGSEHRQHSDLFLESIVVPALQEFNLTVVRADQIGKPGMITSQIIEHIIKSKLVIADLSFHNPNVFYEIAIRHACRMPTVQIIRKSDRIPFDLTQVRTIQIDTSSIYSLVPQIEVYKSYIAVQVRSALADPESVDTPMSPFYSAIKEALG